MYIYAHSLVINEAYKKGNSRVGCLFCPMGGGKSDCFRNLSYPIEIQSYTDIIKEAIDESSIIDYESYITNGGWESRGSGRDLKGRQSPYKEETKGNTLLISVSHPTPNWREWVKTLGELPFEYTIETTKDGCIAKMPASADKTPYAKLLKQVMLKAAYCVGCRVCEANCRNGCISFKNGLNIDGCVHCGQCHIIPYGCYVADCLKNLWRVNV